MRKIFNDDFFSREKILEDIYEKLSLAEEKEEYIDYFYKVEKLNKELRKDFYNSSIEMIRSMEIFFPEEEEIWKDENFAHKEVFISPVEVFQNLNRQYSFYKLLNNIFNVKTFENKNDVSILKKDYVEFIKKYIALISAKGFKDMYRNYVDILEKSNNVFEELMIPMTSIINKDEYSKIIEDPGYIKIKKEEFLETLKDYNNNNFKKFYNSSLNSQREIVNKTEEFSETVIKYYDEIFVEIIKAIREGNNKYNCLEENSETRNFEEYYIFMKSNIDNYLNEYIKSKNFKEMIIITKEKTKHFIKGNENTEVDILKDEIKILKEKIKYLENQIKK